MTALILHVATEDRLPDNEQWVNRFTLRSETSNRLYTVAQNRAKRHWACSCPGYIRHRRCKHLNTLRLPAYEQPYEASLG